MKRWSVLLIVVLLLAGLGLAAPGAAKEKLPDTDLTGLAVLMGGDPAPPAIPAPSPTPAIAGATAATSAPATSGELTLDRFALGFGLIVVGAFGAAVVVLLMRRMRRMVNTSLAQQGDPGAKKNTSGTRQAAGPRKDPYR
jgi:hypothetical protein